MEPVHIVITGAAGNIGYALAFRIAAGDLLGDRKMVLHLLEIAPALPSLEGVVMELNDCAFPNLVGIVATDDVEKAFTGADIVFLVGAFPRKAGMERAELLEKNAGIFKAHGGAIDKFAKKTVKVLVVGNPANTNCLIAIKSAPSLKPENFSAMTRLDHNRAVGMLAQKSGVTGEKVRKVTIWGNHSNTQVPDASSAVVDLAKETKITEKFEEAFLHGEFVTTVSTRGGAIIKARGLSSAASAANAAINQMHDWIFGTPENDWVSMAIYTHKGNPYGISEGLVYSFPVKVDKQGVVHIVEGLPMTPWLQEKMTTTEKELIAERADAKL